MKFLKKLKRLFELSLIKTCYFNIKYFGWRHIFYPYVILSKNVKLYELKGAIKVSQDAKFGTIRIGFHGVGVFDQKFERSIWENSGNVVFGNHVIIGSGVRISNHGELFISDNVNITANSTVICYKKITIGKDCMISWENLIMDNDFHKIYYDTNVINPINEAKEIDIGEHSWICCRCLILKGVKLFPNTVVAAGSTISGFKSSKGNIIIGEKGNLIKENIIWKE